MVTLGVDAHKRSHTIVAVDANGRQLASKTITTTTKDHLGLLNWAEQFAEDGEGLCWAVEDCRHLSRRLERDLLAAGQSIVRVPPKLMAHVRDSARTYGKSDPIDALAVARAAQREPGLPVARLDGPDRDVRLLSDHRETLVAERTRAICRLRWHLHELDPGWEPKSRSLDRISTLDAVAARIQNLDGTVARLARGLVDRSRELTLQITDLTTEITVLVSSMAPALIAIPGCGAITAASNKARHRLSRTGNRQLNAALHRIALTQAHWHEPAKLMMQRRKAGGDSGMEALRVLKRRLSDVVYAALRADLQPMAQHVAA